MMPKYKIMCVFINSEVITYFCIVEDEKEKARVNNHGRRLSPEDDPLPTILPVIKTPQIKLSVKERRKEVDKKLKNRIFRDYLEFGRIKSTKLDAVFGKRLAANRRIGSRFGVDGAV